MVVDAQVDLDVAAAAVPAARGDDEQRRALPAAPVAAGLVARGQGGEQPVGRAAPVVARASQAPLHRLDDLGAGEDVALDRVAVAGAAAGPGVAGARR